MADGKLEAMHRPRLLAIGMHAEVQGSCKLAHRASHHEVLSAPRMLDGRCKRSPRRSLPHKEFAIHTMLYN
mgnify:CR=1 FL=1